MLWYKTQIRTESPHNWHYKDLFFNNYHVTIYCPSVATDLPSLWMWRWHRPLKYRKLFLLFIKILLFYYNFYSTSRGTGKNMPRLSLSHTLTWPWGAEKCPKRSPEIPRWQQAYPLLQADGSRQDVKSGGGTYVIIFSTEHSWRVQNYHKGHLRRGSLEFCNQISVHP